MKEPPEFHVELQPDEVLDLLHRCAENDKKSVWSYKGVQKAGAAIRNGTSNHDDILYIYRWKNASSLERFKLDLKFENQNKPEEIKDAFRLAVNAQTDRAALAVLCGLQQVSIPTASAFLMAMFPERFTVIDVLALRALNYTSPSSSKTIDLYLRYNKYCKSNYHKHTKSLRDFDCVLWQKGSDMGSAKKK